MGTVQEESQGGSSCASMPVHEWKRVLWKTQPYLDNYVPREVFLASLQRNGKSQVPFQGRTRVLTLTLCSPHEAHFRPYAYWPLVILTCTITQHLSVILVFLATFVRLHRHLLDPRTLISICVLCFLVCYTAQSGLSRRQRVDGKFERSANAGNNRKYPASS